MQDHASLLASIARQAMIDRGLQPDFSAAAEKQLASISQPASENGVRDLRDLLWCSIDNDDSRDLDQLTVAQDLGGGNVRPTKGESFATSTEHSIWRRSKRVRSCATEKSSTCSSRRVTTRRI